MSSSSSSSCSEDTPKQYTEEDQQEQHQKHATAVPLAVTGYDLEAVTDSSQDTAGASGRGSLYLVKQPDYFTMTDSSERSQRSPLPCFAVLVSIVVILLALSFSTIYTSQHGGKVFPVVIVQKKLRNATTAIVPDRRQNEEETVPAVSLEREELIQDGYTEDDSSQADQSSIEPEENRTAPATLSTEEGE